MLKIKAKLFFKKKDKLSPKKCRKLKYKAFKAKQTKSNLIVHKQTQNSTKHAKTNQKNDHCCQRQTGLRNSNDLFSSVQKLRQNHRQLQADTVLHHNDYECSGKRVEKNKKNTFEHGLLFARRLT